MKCQKCGAEVEHLTPVNSQSFAVYEDSMFRKLITYKFWNKVCNNCVRGAIQDPEYAKTELYDRKHEASKELERGEITPDQYTVIVRGIAYRLNQLPVNAD